MVTEDALRRRVKAELRKRMRGLRKALPASACAQRSKKISERLLALGPFARARTLALFWPMHGRHEVDLLPLAKTLRDSGLRVAFPRTDPSAGTMTFHFVDDTDRMLVGPLGLREPSADEPSAAPGDLDAIVVPALAVDPRGHRIGYGGGYYDRALPAYLDSAATMSVAFDFQLVVEVPDMPGDVAVHWVVTDVRTLKAGTQEPSGSA